MKPCRFCGREISPDVATRYGCMNCRLAIVEVAIANGYAVEAGVVTMPCVCPCDNYLHEPHGRATVMNGHDCYCHGTKRVKAVRT